MIVEVKKCDVCKNILKEKNPFYMNDEKNYVEFQDKHLCYECFGKISFKLIKDISPIFSQIDNYKLSKPL